MYDLTPNSEFFVPNSLPIFTSAVGAINRKAALFQLFVRSLSRYCTARLMGGMSHLEEAKDLLVGGLTAKRGRYVRPFLHTSMMGLFLIGLALAPLIRDALPQTTDAGNDGVGGAILGQSTEAQAAAVKTIFSVKPESAMRLYTVKSGDTVSSIAQKFGVTTDTIRWQNDLASEDSIKEGQQLEIPPITGIIHKVKRGDTIQSIAKTYQVDPQVIVNWPFNSFTDDENFGLAVGQLLIVPDGVKPAEKLWQPNAYIANRITPNAGAVSATGSFAWPAGGNITQRFVWYHPAIDIANSGAPDILAADAGTVAVAGWPDNSGYGYRVIINHGNGYSTLYAHMQAVYVTVGQTVNRGDAVGKMGSTGRSTGTHLHFEVRSASGNLDPLNFLQ